MRVLKGILQESLDYYQRLERDLRRRLIKLPNGSVKRRRIQGHDYYYLQQRQGRRVIHRYLGRQAPAALAADIARRRRLRAELAQVREALKLLPRKKLQS